MKFKLSKYAQQSPIDFLVGGPPTHDAARGAHPLGRRAKVVWCTRETGTVCPRGVHAGGGCPPGALVN